jgi:putative phosphoesterase
MKALVVSDIHSNIYALQAIWEREHDSDVLYCAGDLVDYGPFPCEVLAWMRDHNAVCVQGNHDAWVVMHYRQCPNLWDIPEDEYLWVHHNARRLSEDEVEFLEQLPQSVSFVMDGITYHMQHLFREYESILSLYEFRRFWREHVPATVADLPNKRLIFGHTHRQAIHYLSDGELWLNPGSVSYRRPDDPTKEAHYLTITDGVISLKALAYDRTPLYEAVKRERMKQAELDVAYTFFGPEP